MKGYTTGIHHWAGASSLIGLGLGGGSYHTILDGVAGLMRDRRPENCMMWNLGWRMEILDRCAKQEPLTRPEVR